MRHLKSISRVPVAMAASPTTDFLAAINTLIQGLIQVVGAVETMIAKFTGDNSEDTSG